DRYHDVRPEEEEKIKEEVAWEVAEWYYVSAYSFYMKAKEEKAKYDEIEKKIEELEGILDQLEARPERCAVMAKMLAVDVITYDPKYFRYVYELNGQDVELLSVEPAFVKVREMVLFEELERLRNGNPIEQELYKELEGRAEDQFDKIVDEAYEKAYDERKADGRYPADAKNVKIVIDLYNKLGKVKGEAEQKMKLIQNALAVRNPRITKTENAQTREFYTVYYEGIEGEMREGRLAGRTLQLGITDPQGRLLSKEKIFEGSPEAAPQPTPVRGAAAPTDGWTCSKGHAGNTGNFCSVCGEPKPVAGWTCPNGHTGNTGNFCAVCGAPKDPEPEQAAAWTCSNGHAGNTGNFCAVCGEKRPETKTSWDCPQCGNKGIEGNFCIICGCKKPVKMEAPSGAWICTQCGQTGNTGNFCAKCGSKKP
ncbi:MAG: hypothetical protein IJ198_14510, partial [Lachnospiraceae bacterium]|nr:hypothetical protein [Lachnospiraceae bacterium]